MSVNLLYCRFCAKHKRADESIDLSTNLNKRCEVIEKLSIAINYVDFSDTTLPETVCCSCLNTLNVSHEFFMNIIRSQTILLRIISDDNFEFIDEYAVSHEASSNVQVKNELGEAEELSLNGDKIKIENQYDNEADAHACQKTCDDEATKPTSLTVSVCRNIKCEKPIDTKSDKSLKKTIDCNSSSNSKTVCMKQEFIDIPIIKDEAKRTEEVQVSSYSWISYEWCCRHCKERFNTMDEVRTHSKEVHNFCYGFKCMDCKEEFNMFNAFIEHVRQHKDLLRYYCQYCNLRFESKSECLLHITTHWQGTQKICSMCGEVLPDQAALERHMDLYKKLSMKAIKKRNPTVVKINNDESPSEMAVKSWDDYHWSCQECCQRFPNVATLRIHTQEVHNKCFSMKCMDCLTVMKSIRMFVAHVTKHRPYLKEYCNLCNIHMEDEYSMIEHIKGHMSGAQKPCDGCGQIFENNELLLKHMKEFDAPRTKGNLTTEDVTCDICNKDCRTLSRLRMHRRVHNTHRERHYVCDTCGKTFLNESSLNEHIKVHKTKTEICNICKRAFYYKRNLKAHMNTHSDSKPVRCDECGKGFSSKGTLKYHMAVHSDVKPYACPECGKSFRHNNNLRVHLLQHTGVKPYSCEVCARTFTNWGNCDKHMVRKHNITLAKTKKTSRSKFGEKGENVHIKINNPKI